jgi:PAS domain S-box-containing protein
VTQQFPKVTDQKQLEFHKKSKANSSKRLYLLAFENSLLANLISTVSSGKIISVNPAACKLLDYSKKELLNKNRADIFDINESSYKKLFNQRETKGVFLVTVIPKNGNPLLCEITSAIFTDEDGIEKTITTIADMSASILKQKNIDSLNKKKVSDNIILARSKQKNIDTENEKIVADNIVLAKSNQIEIDIIKEKIVADNIILAIAKQIEIDVKNKKIVAENIVRAISKQIDIDVKNKKIVAHNIALAIARQKNIDTKKEKIVADNIVRAVSKQIKIDIKNKRIVAQNIALAKLKQKNIDTKKEKIVADNIILAQTESDARLVKNNEFIKYIAKTSYDVMWDWDIATGLIYVSDSIEEVFGYKVQNNTLNFTDVTRCLLPAEKDSAEKKLYQMLSLDHKSWNDAFTVRRFDGSVASTTSRASIVRDKKGKAVRLIGATQDAGKLQQLENKLDEQISIQEEHSETFFLAAKLSSDVIWDWNLLTDALFIGEGYEELVGDSLKNNNGNIPLSGWGNYQHPDDKEAVEKGLHEAIASPAAHWEHAYRLIKDNGAIVKVFNRASIFRDAQGKACRMIGALQNITERKKTEREKELIIKELMKSNADLKQFSYITSHNLRAPLSNIESILSIIDYSTLDTANAEMLKLLNASGKQLSKTIDDLTKILVIKKNVNAEIRAISLTDAFIQLNHIFSSALEEAGAKVCTDFTDPDIDFNETYLESILINLFSNAIKYRSPHRSLVIHASSENDNNGNTIFRFSDNGSGIDIEKHKDRVFGLYQRFHDSVEGHGLGLYIIKSQIEVLNSTIDIESTLDKGTTFIITFKKQSV